MTKHEDDIVPMFYLINDEKGGAYILGTYETLTLAVDAANERYNTMGKACHVEGEGNLHLYNPKHEEY